MSAYPELGTLVYWIEERERARVAKAAGRPKPWTKDRLLRDYRWCNVKRMDDRVSQELLNEWYDHGVGMDGATQVIAATLARLVNRTDTLREVSKHRPFRTSRVLSYLRQTLAARDARGETVFTGAYLIPGVAGRRKTDSVCDLVERVAVDARTLAQQTSMKACWRALTAYPGLGSFLAGQIAADLAQLPLGVRWDDRHRWAPLGPGSARGLNRLRGYDKDRPLKQAEFDQELPALIEVLRPRIKAIWYSRSLVAMDVQNCLCEFDKYLRLTRGEGTVRARYPGGGLPEILA